MAKKQSIKPRSIMIRVSEASDMKLITDIEKETGERTSSGAFMNAAKNYLQQKKELVKAYDSNSDLRNRLQAAEELLNRQWTLAVTIAEYGKKHFVKGKYPQPDLF